MQGTLKKSLSLKAKSQRDSFNKKKKHEEKDVATRGISAAQLMFRQNKMYPERLHRHNIGERLQFESNVVFGTARLINQILVFALFLSALRLSSDEGTKRGIYNNLGDTFDFESLREIPSRAVFVQDILPVLSKKAKEFFPLSSQYFDAGEHGSKLLLNDLTVYTQPVPGPEMTLKSTEFSFVAWVRSIPQFAEGYILRKRPVSTNEELSCWGWYLHAEDGASFRFAGHDHFPTGADRTEQQIEAKLNTKYPFDSGRYFLMAIVVNDTAVSFYQDNIQTGTVPLARPVTDCFNNGQGLWLGDSGLELGVVRYFPFQLSNWTLKELMFSGNLLQDVATGSTPSEDVDPPLTSTGRGITEEVLNVNKKLEARHEEEKLTSILKQVDEADVQNFVDPGPPRYPNAKIGTNPFDNIERVDENGRDYYRLFEGPEILSTTSNEDARNMTNWPSFFGTGATFTFWYRHIDCDVATCGLFLFEAIDPSRPAAQQKCWNFWIENNAIWYENAETDMYPKEFVPKNFQIEGGKTWRHIAITLDETTDEFKYYMDGKHAYTGPWRGDDLRGRTVAQSDCTGPGRFMTLGRSHPGYTYGQPVGMYDFRMYVHPRQGGNPLTEQEIFTISRSPVPLGNDEMCALASDPTFFDSEWRDAFGHSCAWYNNKREANPSICRSALAAVNCPIACGTRQECFNDDGFDTTFIYDRIRKIEVPPGLNGTICLGDEEERERVVEVCRQYVVGGLDMEVDQRAQQWFTAWRSARSRGVDLRLCDDLDRAINEHCSFKSSRVGEWTEAVVAGGGEYSIAFWIKPEGFGSLVDQRFFPSVKFFGSISPPQHNLAIGLWENPNGEAQFFTNCGPGEFDMENVELKRADESGWTFVAVTKTNATRQAMVVTNLGKWDETFKYDQCLYDDSAFFRGIEFNYPVLISPIMLSAKAVPLAKLQETYYSASGWMPEKAGPLASAKENAESEGLVVEKRDYPEQSTLVAPPIIFQTLETASQDCGFSYSKNFINFTHFRMKELKCSDPYNCDADLLRDPATVLSCPGDKQEEGTFFGQNTQDFGEIGYSELLFSITDNGFLFRDNQLMQTTDFISSSTAVVEIVMVFYTPKFGITSVLSLIVDFNDPSGAASEVDLAHFELLEGGKLREYMFVQIVVLVFIAIMVFDIVVTVKYTLMQWAEDDIEPMEMAGEAFKQLLDLSIAVMVIVYIIWRIPSQLSSEEDTRKIVGTLAEIPWAQTDLSAEAKTVQFFDSVRELRTLIAAEKDLNTFCNVVLILSLLRLIKCTSMHPRLALLEGTIIKAWDDLWHAALLIVLLMGVFAGIATWRFGSEREDFSTFERSMQTQFEMTFGEFPDDWQATRDLQVYTVFYFMLVFLLVQNFLLAVVVEAYMAVRKDNEELETEQEFIIDIYTSLHSHMKAFREGWPTPHRLGTEILRWDAKNSVGFKELHSTGMFKSPESVGTFLKHYKHYEFLVPNTIGSHGAEKKDPDEKRAQELELRLAKAMGVSMPSLKEEAAVALRKAQRRREGRRESDGTEQQNTARGLGSTAAPMFAAPMLGFGAAGGHGGGMDPQSIKTLELAGKDAASANAAVGSLAKEMEGRFQDTNLQVSMVKDRLRNMDVKMDFLIRILHDGQGGPGSDPTGESPNGNGYGKANGNGNGNGNGHGIHSGPPTYGSKVYHGRDQVPVVDAADRERPPEAPVMDRMASGTGVRAEEGSGVSDAHAQLMFEQRGGQGDGGHM